MSRAPATVGTRIAWVAAVVLAAGAVATSAQARVAHDPCGPAGESHVTHSGLHCGKVFGIPGHFRQHMPYYARPPSCDARTEEIAGVPIETFGEWNYWTEHGQWVLFAGDIAGVSRGDHGQPININPYFQNWGPHLWKVRVFFNCKKRY